MSLYAQPLLDLHEELIVDLFAGGGGASSGIEQALGRMVDVAVNHDRAAVELHKANHPQTIHHVSDVFEICPRRVTAGRPVGLLWASPDCTFHSKARGAKPIRHKTKRRRALAWVVTRWAGQVRPRVIMLENVEEFADWGPLVGRADSLRPCAKRRGKTFRRWVNSLRAHGYRVEWRELRACDYGAPTIRKRLFVIARCDGQSIAWPEPTHGPGRAKPYRTAGECIDFSIPMCSIFATPEEAKAWAKEHGVATPVRPLAEKSLARIARGIDKFVLKNPRPFLVTLNHGGSWQRAWDPDQPFRTQTASRDAHALVAPVFVPRYGEREGQEPRCRSVEEPGPVVVPSGNGAMMAAAFLAQYNDGFAKSNSGDGHRIDSPVSTVSTKGPHQAVIAANLVAYHDEVGGNARASGLEAPIATLDCSNRFGLVAAFLAKYYGMGVGEPLDSPAGTLTAENKFSVVTVDIDGEPHAIVDIAMRMLGPRELYRCQGFRDSYIIDRGADGRALTKTEQVRMVGNSVCPPVAEALVTANLAELRARPQARRTA